MEIDLPVIQPTFEIGSIDMDKGEIRVHPENHVQYSCSLSGDCCTRFHIPVTDFDIERIEKHGYELDQIVDQASPFIKLPKTENGSIEKNYRIKRQPYSGACTFLEQGKCSIHEFKPFGCRIFPFQLKFEGNNIVRVQIHESNYCPSVIASNPENSQNKEFLFYLKQQLEQEMENRERYFKKFGVDG